MKSRDQILLEKAYLQVIKEQVDSELELYHATTIDNMDSFVQKGIDTQLAGTLHNGAGASQGKGFYIFKDKRDAINHTHQFVEGDDSIIIVIKAKQLDPKDFDIDYEAEGWLAKKFLKYLITNNLIDVEKYQIKVLEDYVSIKIGSIRIGLGALANLDKEDNEILVNEANALSSVFKRLEEIQPELFARFEKENLNQAMVLKYNGSEKIWPARIENPEGRVLWSKERDQGSWDDVWKRQ